jgi:hypothetical protein
MALAVPVLDSTRIREELGWGETRDTASTLREWLTGVAEDAGGPTPPLRPDGEPETAASGASGAGQ